MADDLILDSEWFVDQIIAINSKLAALPEIEKHLARQNTSISAALKQCRGLDLRVIAIETSAKSRTANWQKVLDLGLRLVEGLVLAYLLANVLGIT